MPRLQGVSERRDLIAYGTKHVEPGATETLINPWAKDAEKHSIHQDNAYQFSHLDSTLVVQALGLRLVGLAPEVEDRWLDELIFHFIVGDHPQAGVPGNLCSTFRYVNEETEITPGQILADEKRDCGVCDARFKFLPGYVLQRPFMVPVRQNFSVRVEASERFAPPAGTPVRAFLFTLQTRDVC